MGSRKMTRSELAPEPLTFSTYQREVESTDESKKFLVSLLGLVGELGDIQTVVKRWLEQRGYPRFKDDFAEEIGDTLWYLASLASRLELSLQEIASRNIDKARQLHTQGHTQHFDRAFPSDERLPRQFRVTFEEKPLGNLVQVKMMLNGVFIGDSLTDNAHTEDGYRYHDAFHLAYAAVLGWSPVTRALLVRKRKSDPQTDEVEDGARAKIVEEAISIFLFNQAQARDEFRELRSIDIGLLKTVKRLSGDLEVKRCTAKQWQSAIHQGYQIFRQLRDNKGGTVCVDLDKTTVSYVPARQRLRKGGTNARSATKRLSKRLEGRGTTTAPKPRRNV
jgi:NTP pyrophosphatase (non-canonical NTP hydrolase)